MLLSSIQPQAFDDLDDPWLLLEPEDIPLIARGLFFFRDACLFKDDEGRKLSIEEAVDLHNQDEGTQLFVCLSAPL